MYRILMADGHMSLSTAIDCGRPLPERGLIMLVCPKMCFDVWGLSKASFWPNSTDIDGAAPATTWLFSALPSAWDGWDDIDESGAALVVRAVALGKEFITTAYDWNDDVAAELAITLRRLGRIEEAARASRHFSSVTSSAGFDAVYDLYHHFRAVCVHSVQLLCRTVQR